MGEEGGGDGEVARSIDIPNNTGMRRQPPAGEVGEAKLWSHFHWTPNSVELAKSKVGQRGGQKPSNFAMYHATSKQDLHDGI